MIYFTPLIRFKLASYTDDNSTYTREDNLESLLKVLETETSSILNWFRNNEMNSNDDKCHFLCV